MKGIIKNKIYHKYEKENSKFRKIGKPLGSWTVNLDWIKNKIIDIIIYETQTFIYKINFELAKNKGIIKIFNGEIKLIVPIKYWEITNKKEQYNVTSK